MDLFAFKLWIKSEYASLSLAEAGAGQSMAILPTAMQRSVLTTDRPYITKLCEVPTKILHIFATLGSILDSQLS